MLSGTGPQFNMILLPLLLGLYLLAAAVNTSEHISNCMNEAIIASISSHAF